MIWDHYIPITVAGGLLDKQAEQQGSTILDFAGMNPQRLIGEAESIVRDCVNSGAKRLLVNIDGEILMNLIKRLAPLGGCSSDAVGRRGSNPGITFDWPAH